MSSPVLAAWGDGMFSPTGLDLFARDGEGRYLTEFAVEVALPALGVILAVRLVVAAVRRAVTS